MKQQTLAISKRRRRRQAGQAMLEAALVFTVAVSMVVFILDMGRLMLTQQWIAERARATARAAAVNNWDANAAANYLVYNSTTAPQSGQGIPGGLMGLVPSQVSYSAFGNPGDPDYRIQIKVTGVPLVTVIPFIAGKYTAPPIVATVPGQSLGASN